MGQSHQCPTTATDLRASYGFLTAMAVAVMVCSPVQAQHAAYNGVTYAIVNANSGKVVDVSGGSTAAETPCFQYPYHATTNQQWTAWYAGNGFWGLSNINSQMCLSVSGDLVSPGDAVVQRPYVGKPEQQWMFQSYSDGTYYIVNRKSGEVLDVDGASTADGAKIQQYTNGGYKNQRWTLKPIATLKPDHP